MSSSEGFLPKPGENNNLFLNKWKTGRPVPGFVSTQAIRPQAIRPRHVEGSSRGAEPGEGDGGGAEQRHRQLTAQQPQAQGLAGRARGTVPRGALPRKRPPQFRESWKRSLCFPQGDRCPEATEKQPAWKRSRFFFLEKRLETPSKKKQATEKQPAWKLPALCLLSFPGNFDGLDFWREGAGKRQTHTPEITLIQEAVC